MDGEYGFDKIVDAFISGWHKYENVKEGVNNSVLTSGEMIIGELGG